MPMDKAKEVIKILQKGEDILPGTLSKIHQKRRLKIRNKVKSKSYWYLTWKEDGRSKAIYILPRDVPLVLRGIENMKKVKEYIATLAIENLKRLKEARDVHKRG